MKTPSVIFLSILLILLSCTNLEIKNRLNDIESFIQEHPDSALNVLESMDKTYLKGRRNRAHHALLHAMALDKNYIDVTDDSLARTALNYFEKWGPKECKARSVFYLGVYYYNTKAYNDAIIRFTESEDLCRETGDMVYCYLSVSSQADTYNKMYNDEEEYRCICKAKDIVYEHQLTKYIDFVNLRLGQAYMNRQEYDKASDIFNGLINKHDSDSLILGHAISSIAFLKMVQDVPDPEAAAELFDKAYEEYGAMGMKLKDFWAWAAALHTVGKIQAADELITQLDKESDISDSFYWKYQIAKNNDDIENALYYMEQAWNEGGNEINAALQQSLARYQRDYYQTLSFIEAHKAEKRMYLILLCVVISVCIGIISLWHIKKINRDKVHLVQFAEEMSRITNEEQTKNNELKKKYLSLYKSKNDILQTLCDQYFTSQNRRDAEKLMYKKVSSIIDDLRNDTKHRIEFEKIIDQDLDDIMHNIRSEMPKLKEIDYILFSFFITGFDTLTISQLTGVTEGNIYARKRRMRIKIQENHPTHEEQFLEMLS